MSAVLAERFEVHPLKAKPHIQKLLQDNRFVAVDIGARGDIPEPWLALDGIANFICVEPDSVACEALRKTYAARGNVGKYRIVAEALTSTGGPRTLYITAGRGGSSLFNPDIPIIRDYTNEDYLYPIEQVSIETRSVAEVFGELDEPQLDLMKLDIQGCELDVLQGLSGAHRDSLLLVELECSMQPKNPGYPTFCDINAYMLSQGMELLDVWPNRIQRQRNGRRAGYHEDIFGVHVDSPSISARIWEVDALYVRSLDPLLETGDIVRLLKLVTVYCLYGFFSEAMHALDEAENRGLLDKEQLQIASSAVAGWHRDTRYRRRYAVGFWGDVYRRVIGALNLRDQITGADYVRRLR